VLSDAAKDMHRHLDGMDQEILANIEEAKEEVRVWLRRWCKKKIGRRPMVLPVVIEV
jgi:ribonuclease J